MSTYEQIFKSLTPLGWLDEIEAPMLWKAAEMTTGAIVEVGSYHGRSAMLLASFGRPLYCVDPWDSNFTTDYTGDQIYASFLNNLAAYSNVIPVRCKVEEWTPIEAGLVYLDGDHTYEGTLRQIRKALECHPQVLAMHDVNDGGEGKHVKRAALELLGKWYNRANKLAIWKLR